MEVTNGPSNQMMTALPDQQVGAKVQYICGQCGKKNELAPGAAEIKCKHCLGRIFYKVRQRQPLQYEAR
eukprot:CAMPEP_0170481458 /NCGR_PEP_ID=MMETSP0208-20121228/1899_1 /TAXON_ID=197538 /ORGANISM="Strombidium inclinatum, Strain S3" /LENGTH=68 /DNA_ID=CAMNT_0010754167 /DNA_START=1 /DNA_END=207 /DNA_ORIENTATION=+